ncbi:MAG: hypothetical protein AMXMBFR47_42690 [Planctomycetota bacterium]
MNHLPSPAGAPGESGGACEIPPEVYEIAFGWDPTLERDRFLALAGHRPVRAALELGCGAGRLLAAVAERVDRVVGVELSPAMAGRAEARLADAGLASRCRVDVGDMSCVGFDGEFDLVYSSANTIRHVVDDSAIARLWSGIGRALRPGGAAVFDLELGIEYEAARVGAPAIWTLAAGEEEVRAAWEVVTPPCRTRRCSGIRWTFEHPCPGRPQRRYSQSFTLRAFDAADLVAFAAGAAVEIDSFYEPRDPYLLAIDAAHASGRCLAVFRKTA